MPQTKKKTNKKPYFANTDEYKKKTAKGMKPGAAKKAGRKMKRKAAVAKVKKTGSRLLERINPFDKESKAKRSRKKFVKSANKAGAAAKKTILAKRAASKTKAVKTKSGTVVRKGAVSKVSTKGGDFVKYKKKSKAAGSFRAAFKANCSGKAKSFTWDGRSYSCKKK